MVPRLSQGREAGGAASAGLSGEQEQNTAMNARRRRFIYWGVAGSGVLRRVLVFAVAYGALSLGGFIQERAQP
jgi:hypothetical protein